MIFINMINIFLKLDKKAVFAGDDAKLIMREVDKFFNDLENSQGSIQIPANIDICRLISSIRNKFHTVIGADKKNGFKNVEDLRNFHKRLKDYEKSSKYEKLSNHIRGYGDTGIIDPNLDN